MPSDRKLSGKYAIRGLGENDLTWKANAYGNGPGDHRKVSARALGLPTTTKPTTLSADGVEGEADLAALKLTRARLTRGKLAAMARGIKTGPEHAPITVHGDTVIDGNHRIAAMLLDGKKGKVKVKLLGQPQETKKAMKMPTRAEMKAMSEADLKALDKEMHATGEESSAEHDMLAEVCAENECAMPCGMSKQAGPKGKMKMVAGMMASKGAKPESVAEDAGMKPDRMTALMAGDAEPTDDEVKVMMAAVGKMTKADLGLSLYAIENKIRDAVRKKYGVNTSVRDVYPESDTAIIELYPPWDGMSGMVTQTDKSRTYWAEYELGDDGTVTLGDWEEVEQASEWVPIEKAANALASTKIMRWIGAALARLDVTPTTLALKAGVAGGVMTALLNGTVAHLGAEDAKGLAEVLGVEVGELQAALGDALVAAADIQQAELPIRENVTDETTVAKSVEYRARHVGSGEFMIEGLNGDREALAKSLNGSAGVYGLVLEDPGKMIVRVDRYRREAPPLGAELLIKADVRYEADEPEARDLPFIGSPAELRKAAELGVLYAVAYAPGDETTPDLQGEWTDAEEIRKAAHAYLAQHRVIKRQHEGKATDDQVVESYIAPQDLTINKKLVKAGSWVVGIKLGAESKKLVKAGKMRGISIGGTKKVAA